MRALEADIGIADQHIGTDREAFGVAEPLSIERFAVEPEHRRHPAFRQPRQAPPFVIEQHRGEPLALVGDGQQRRAVAAHREPRPAAEFIVRGGDFDTAFPDELAGFGFRPVLRVPHQRAGGEFDIYRVGPRRAACGHGGRAYGKDVQGVDALFTQFVIPLCFRPLRSLPVFSGYCCVLAVRCGRCGIISPGIVQTTQSSESERAASGRRVPGASVEPQPVAAQPAIEHENGNGGEPDRQPEPDADP